MELLLLLLIIFVFFPLFKVIFAVGKTAHTFKKAYDQQTKQYAKAKQEQTENAEKNGRKERMRSFFKRTSEDVEFEEIKTDRTAKQTSVNRQTTSGNSSAKPGISDAHFEDV